MEVMSHLITDLHMVSCCFMQSSILWLLKWTVLTTYIPKHAVTTTYQHIHDNKCVHVADTVIASTLLTARMLIVQKILLVTHSVAVWR